MNKQQLISALKAHSRCDFVSRKQLTTFLGLKDPKSVDTYIHGLPSVNQRYFIPDVADEILQQCKWR